MVTYLECQHVVSHRPVLDCQAAGAASGCHASNGGAWARVQREEQAQRCQRGIQVHPTNARLDDAVQVGRVDGQDFLERQRNRKCFIVELA